MDKLGLGVIDKHTIIIVLLTLVVAQVLFGFAIPIDTSAGVTQLFIDIVLFTGYIYLARSIYRLPVAIIASAIYIKDDPLKKLALTLHYSIVNAKYGQKIQGSLSVIFVLIVAPIMVILGFILGVLSFEYYGGLPELKKFQNPWLQFLLKILDRLGIIALAFVATLPSTTAYVYKIGVIGICFMILMFILRGDFTAVIKDALSKPEIPEPSKNTNEVSGEKKYQKV